jgi:peroxiredoxin family protein/TusA-related sulfurtransferase
VKKEDLKNIIEVDACGLQCPGPIQQLKKAIDSIEPGGAVRIKVTDPGFLADIPAWCNTTGHDLLDLKSEKGAYLATVIKRQPGVLSTPVAGSKKMSIVVFSGDFDKAMAAFIIANGAASMGYEPTLFFTFWGLNVIRKDYYVPVKKNLIEKMFGWMMPRGAEKLALSNMNMAGMGLSMIKGIMKKKNVASLPDLISSAQASGVKLVACAMSMDLMGFSQEELLDGVEKGGVAMYLDRAGAGNINLFI